MLKQLFGINSATGINISIHTNGELTVNACQIAKQNNQLNFEKKLTGLRSVEELSKSLNNKIPVSLNLSGKGILHKQIEKIDELTQANFAQVLPNAAFDDFYIQNFVSGDLSFISVIRKSEADKWIEQLKANGFTVVLLNLGPFPVDNILPQLNLYNGEVTFDGHRIQIDDNGQWKNYNYDGLALAPFVLKIESEKIDEKLLIAYASAFQLVMADKLEPVQAFNDVLANAYRDALTSKWIRAYGSIAIMVTFILLLINFMLFSWLNSDNATLAYQASRSAQSSSDIKGMEDKVKQKELQLKALGWNNGISKARMVDELAAVLPDEITWKNMEINPVDVQGSRDQKALKFRDRRIIVSGLSEQVIPVNEWIARIRIKHWVKTVELESYNLNPELHTGQFTITISY